MNKFFNIQMEVAGGLGKNAVVDFGVRPPKISHLHYEIEGWLGDQLLETFPGCYIVTERLAKIFTQNELKGFELESLEVTTNDEFDVMYSNCKLPRFRWLKIKGEAGIDDFGLALGKIEMIVSKKALLLILPLCPHASEITPYLIGNSSINENNTTID